MLIHRWLEDAARRTPDALAIIDTQQQSTYGELDRRANQCAHLFRRLGVMRGDRVVIALDNCLESAAAYFGALKAGAVAVPMAPGPRNDRFAHAIADCAPRAAIIDPATAQGLREGHVASVPVVLVAGQVSGRGLISLAAAEDCPDEPVSVRSIDLDLAAIIYTSGSLTASRAASC